MAMTSVGILEAKTHLSTLVDRVAEGEEVTITRHGKPVARLVALASTDSEIAKQVFARMRELRKGTTLGGLDWKTLRDEGRR
jgi:prevent-host-death family protein